MKRSAIIGLGEIANIHLPVLLDNPGIELAAACDINPALSAKAPGARFYSDYQEMLAVEELDCVHICLPHYLHLPAARSVIEKGVHVFCEKPPALDIGETRALISLAASRPELRIGICLQNRLNESFQKLMTVIASGRLGPVLGIKGFVPWQRTPEYYSASPWRRQMATAGGGVMINQAIHTLDLMQLIGGDIVSIRGSIANLLDFSLEVEDTAAARIQFANGAAGLFFATNANCKNNNVEIEVTLADGVLLIQDNCLFEQQAAGRVKLAEDAVLPGSKSYYGASHRLMINQFYQGLETGCQEYVQVREAAVSMQMIDLIRRSSATGQTLEFQR